MKTLKELFPIIKVEQKETKEERVRELHKHINELLYNFAFDYLYVGNAQRILKEVEIICKELKEFDDKKASEIVQKARAGYKAVSDYISKIVVTEVIKEDNKVITVYTTNANYLSDEDKKQLKNMLIRKAMNFRKEWKDKELTTYTDYTAYYTKKCIIELEFSEIQKILNDNRFQLSL